ncbi:MAG: hypothetical protein VKN72_04810 [Nostocales cyanobacterium 94392]|nr:hypothetical protein [Nostocales cyanobacterium 94392]
MSSITASKMTKRKKLNLTLARLGDHQLAIVYFWFVGQDRVWEDFMDSIDSIEDNYTKKDIESYYREIYDLIKETRPQK